MIQAEGLTRYYGSFAALRDASFDIGEREIVGFLGLNGAGKSTVLKILAGLLAPTAGTVKIAGVDASINPDVTRARIGFLPEEPPLYREMRVREFLRWVGEVKGKSRVDVDKVLPRVLETCQLSDVADRVIGELSHGYKKRVGIAQSIVHGPDVVILDEPISGLDPQQIVEMRRVVRSLKEQATVLISSHILSEVALTCDRVLVVHRGKIVAEGSETELGRSFGEGTRLTLRVRGNRANIEDRLGAFDAVTNYELIEDGDLLEVRVTLRSDEREQLIADLVRADVGIRSVEDTVSELEQIFLELTRTVSNPTVQNDLAMSRGRSSSKEIRA